MKSTDFVYKREATLIVALAFALFSLHVELYFGAIIAIYFTVIVATIWALGLWWLLVYKKALLNDLVLNVIRITVGVALVATWVNLSFAPSHDSILLFSSIHTSLKDVLAFGVGCFLGGPISTLLKKLVVLCKTLFQRFATTQARAHNERKAVPNLPAEDEREEGGR